jgi:ubiquinone biosynthesis protein
VSTAHRQADGPTTILGSAAGLDDVVIAVVDAGTIAIWVLLVPIAGTAVTWVAGRLLGARRGWLQLLLSGLVGFALGVVLAGALAEWEWRSLEMIGLTLVFGTLLTMVVAVGWDMLAPPGSLARGQQAGLIAIGGRKRLSSAWSPVSRYRELVGLARRNGLLQRRRDLDDPVAAAQMGESLRITLEQAGGLFVKIGQVASTRSDLLPPTLCDELAKLRSGAEPAPEEIVRPEVEAHFGRPVEQVFASFDWTPLASASIAQVYAATTNDGAEVVVKVQRPGLDVLVQRDTAAMMQVAGLLERRTTLGLTLSPMGLAEEFLDGIRAELDFTQEVANAIALAAATPEDSGVRIPAVYPSLSDRTLLVEERVHGVPISDVATLRAAGHDPSELASRLLATTLHHLFQGGVFHADPHPGNVLVEADGTIVLIDLGAMGRLTKQQRDVVMQVMVGASTGDPSLMRQSLEAAGIVGGDVDLAALDRSIDEFVAVHSLGAGGMNASLFEDLLTMLGHYGLEPPRWMASLGRMFVTLEGTLTTVDPSFSLVESAMAEARTQLGPDLELGSLRKVAEAEALTQLPRLRRLPQRIDDLLGQASQGRLAMRMSFLSDQRDVDTITSLVNRSVLAILAASLGIGSVLLLRVGGDGKELVVDEVLGYIGLAVAAVLTLRIVAGVVRDGRT